jgi:glyoxylase-like metal-dependent hydrolase (beta-lactamase superfamily II)
LRIFTAAVPPFMKNGYLVAAAGLDAAVLIDPGDEVDTLIARAADERLDVQAILLTHAHLDHIAGVSQAKAAFQAPTWLHRDDDFLYGAVEEQGLMFGLRVPTQPPVDHFYEPGQRLTVGGLEIAVHLTPGHSPGGVCLEVVEDGATHLFVGDTLFAGSIGRTDLPGGDHETLIRAIKTVLLAFPDDTPVHSGHGPSTTIGEERRSNPFLLP